MFKKNKLSSAVVGVLAASAVVSPAFAQETVEEVYVTGIRASLEASMDVKRNASGVVDSISAEDIGKFPDSNLAESLQRITGVSISRSNGEGSEVTIRGFGAENNLILLNGRHMPTAGVYGGGSGAGGTRGAVNRSFDFANIASESISAVDVYKTGKATIATGGLGGTLNIKTAKPLDNPGFKASVGAKAVMDTTNRTGDDVTPELSGLVSWTDDSERFGVSLTASMQERHSGNTGVAENNWNIARWDSSDLLGNNLYSFINEEDEVTAIIENPPIDGQLYGRPSDLRYSFADIQRTRTNAQLTVQFAPTEHIDFTVDYTYAENDLKERRGESTSWMANGNSIDKIRFDSSSSVATPMYIHETTGPRDQGYEQQLRQQTNTLESFGFNAAFQLTDKFGIAFDVHDSSMESLPTGPGQSGEIAVSMGIPTQMSHWWDFSGEMPTYDWVAFDGTPVMIPVLDENGDPVLDDDGNGVLEQDTYEDGSLKYRGNNNGVVDEGDVGSQVVRVFYAAQQNEVTQMQLSGDYTFDNGRLDFGFESRSITNSDQSSNRYMGMGDWGIANVGDIPTSMIEMYNLSDFDDYDTSKSSQVGVKGDAEVIGQHLVDTYGTDENGYVLAYNPEFSENNEVKEDTTSAYFQITLEGELGGMPANFVTGLRYEKTDVESTSLQLIPQGLLWQDNNDFQTYIAPGTEVTPFRNTASYDNLLPNMDFSLDVMSDVKARFSYSKTIGRAGYGDLRSSVSNWGSGGGSTYNGAIRTASSANPSLLPLESDNYDISGEWYYGDTSYLSVGIFEKRVKNFIGTERVDEEHFGILDQTDGPRADAAADVLADAGIGLDDTSLFVMMALQDNPNNNSLTVDGYIAAAADTAEAKSSYEVAVATAYDILPKDGDPVSVWRTDKPVNNREAQLYGAEFNVQHFFGESGFGVIANYTIVRGDVGYDNAADPSESQFALLGLSDTANLVGIYERDGFQARLAYNWRDEYLRSASQGSFNNPVYVEAHSQIDLNVSYDFENNVSIFFEGLNVTGENDRWHGRTTNMIEYLEDLGARYNLGARYTF